GHRSMRLTKTEDEQKKVLPPIFGVDPLIVGMVGRRGFEPLKAYPADLQSMLQARCDRLKGKGIGDKTPSIQGISSGVEVFNRIHCVAKKVDGDDS
ncbi:MAG: hypothetical protein KDN19_15285, partial [Verrucomicrobiae bacterium]|nr:hypothetical protein [Verrucomicrobiae bacterium]